jgi:hypothetical protein
MSLDETLSWCRELEQAVGHAIAAHSEHWKTEEDAVRFHDKKTPYVVHPIWCAATILVEASLPEEIRRIGYQVLLWHDTLEDTELSLPRSASPQITKLVREMTFQSFEEETREVWNRSDLTKLFKLYDKVSNLLDGSWMRDEKWNRYVGHTRRLADDVASQWPDLNIVKIARAVCLPHEKVRRTRRRNGAVPGEGKQL